MNLQLKNINKDQFKNTLVLVVTTLIVGLLVFFLIVPWLKEILTVSGLISKEKQSENKLTAKEAALSKTQTQEISQTLATLNTALPTEKEIPSLLTGITRLANEAGLSQEGLQINPGQVSSGSAKTKETGVDFSVTLKGNFESLFGFLSNLEKAKRLFVVKEVSATILGEEKTFNIGLKLFAPYESLAPPPNEISEPLPKTGLEEEKAFAEVSKFTDYTFPVPPGAVGKPNPFR